MRWGEDADEPQAQARVAVAVVGVVPTPVGRAANACVRVAGVRNLT
jgi:hypothetical protein